MKNAILYLLGILWAFPAGALEQAPLPEPIQTPRAEETAMTPEQMREQFKNLTAAFREAAKEMQKVFADLNQNGSGRNAATENASAPAVSETVEKGMASVAEKAGEFFGGFSKTMQTVALCADRNKKLPEMTIEDMQEVVFAVQMHPLQENMSSVKDERLGAVTIVGEAQNEAGDTTKISIDRNLALYVMGADILNGTLKDDEHTKYSLTTLLDKSVKASDFHVETVRGYKTYVADTGDSGFAAMILSPYVVIRAETTGDGHLQSVRAVFDKLDLNKILQAMKLPSPTPTVEELIAEMNKEAETPQGKEIVKRFFGTAFGF